MRYLIAVLVAACASGRPVPTGVVQPELGTAHAKSSQAITPVNATGTAHSRSAEASQLVTATEQLDTSVEPARVARAMQALATAIDVIAPDFAGETQDLRSAADDLEHSTTPVATLRTGLDVAVRAMGVAQPPTETDQERFRVARSDMYAAITGIDPTRSIDEQQILVRSVFRAAARAVLAAQDSAAPAFKNETTTAQR